MEWEFGISRCKPVYTGWINNKVLLQSTGDSSISCDKPQWKRIYIKKEHIYICM